MKVVIRLRGCQTDLGLRCPHIPGNTFSHGTALIENKHYSVAQ